MFWVINKDRGYSYMVTLSVIGVLFVMATVIPRNYNNTTETSTNAIVNEYTNTKDNNLKNVIL